MSDKVEEKRLFCSFCGKSEDEVRKLIAGPSVFICGECVDLCNDMIREETQGDQGSEGAKLNLPMPGELAPVPTLSIKQIHAQLISRVVDQDRAARFVSVGIYKHLQRLKHASKDKHTPQKENILLIGPTGTGKTLLAQSLAAIVGIPFAISDATTLSETGYVGEDVESVLVELVKAAGNDVQRAHGGVVFIDEIDKVAARTQMQTHTNRDISGEGVQRGLLRMMEGGKVRVDLSNRNKHPGAQMVEIDTANILFICAGAFHGLDKQIRESTGDPAAELQDVTAEDLIGYGLLPEFVGRFSSIAVLSYLRRDDLKKILTMPLYGVFAEQEWYFRALGVDLVFDESVVEAIAASAEEMVGGARSLRRVVADLLRDVLFEISDRPNIVRCLVEKAVVVLTADDESREELPHYLLDAADETGLGDHSEPDQIG
jgi:ATP-dependent Clp protease ATP-binding subunit ClpX